MLHFDIVPQKTALLIFDMMNDFLLPGAPLENVEAREVLVPKLKKLLPLCRSKGILVAYTSHGHRRNGADVGYAGTIWKSVREGRALIKDTEGVKIYHEIAPAPQDVVIEKLRYSAFYGTDLDTILRSNGKDTLIICGAATNVGCETTARDAFCRDYKVIFPSDGNLVRDMPDVGWGAFSADIMQRVILSTLAHAFCEVITMEQLMKRIEDSSQ